MMQQPRPYFFTSPRMIAMVDRQQMIPAEGPVADAMYGYHTLWAVEVPFIPAPVDRSDRDFRTEATNRIARSMQRQVRFLYDLAQSRDHLTTFELRLVSHPQANGLAKVAIAFLGKVFHPNEHISSRLALESWNKFSAVFPREVPFSYPLIPVQEHAARNQATASFQDWYEPIPFEQLTQFASIVEIRKFEDWPTLRNIGGVYHAHDYIPHPFIAALDYSAMARLFETMAHQQETSVVAITLRPQLLTDQEELILHEHAEWFEKLSKGYVDEDNPVAEVMRELKNHVFEAYPRARAELGSKVFNNLKRESRSLFTIRLQVVGSPTARNDVIESLGSEVMANAGTAYPSRWSRVEATNAQEMKWAQFNFQWLEFARWGISSLIQQCPAIVRLRQLTTVLEAAGAFRLPVAPGGGLAGLEVRDEPFSLPACIPEMREKTVTIGNIVDRGVPTTLPALLPASLLSGVSQIIGDGSATRDQAIYELLQPLLYARLPLVLICEPTTSDAESFKRLDAQTIRIDAHAPALNLDFHPLLPPQGISLNRFIDVIQRILVVACGLDRAASVLLRRALINTYTEAGWTEQRTGNAIDIDELATQIDALVQQTTVPPQLAHILRTRCGLALQDLAATAPNLRNVPCATTYPYQQPIAFTFGWLGSDTSTAILRGCLWAWLSFAMAATPNVQSGLKGLVVLAEAHTLLSPVPDIPITPLAAVLDQLTLEHVGSLLLETQPYLLDGEVTQKTKLSLFTHTADKKAQAYMAAYSGTSERQTSRIAHLRPSEAIVAASSSSAVIITL